MALEAHGNNNIQEQQPDKLYIPNTMKDWPWVRSINPLEDEVTAESIAWVSQFSYFTHKGWDYTNILLKSGSGHFCALLYPTAPREHLRLVVDLCYVMLAADDHADTKAAPAVREMVDAILDVLDNPYKLIPAGAIMFCKAFQDFWVRLLKIAPSSTLKHFKLALIDYLEAVVVSAQHRDDHTLLQSVEEYFLCRREDIAIRPFFFPYQLNLNIPEEALFHPVITEMEYLISEMVSIDNDIASYNKEQAADDLGRNLVALCMRLFSLDVTGAMNRVCQYHYEKQTRFHALREQIPSFGPEVDKAVKEYVDLLGNAVRGSYCHHYECKRYFGDMGRKVQEDGWVPLLPKVVSKVGQFYKNQ